MKVLVTGGAGYVGSQLVYDLAQKDEVSSVIVYDNLSRGNFNLFISKNNRIENGKVKFILGDILDSRKLREVIRGVDVVYHLAGRVALPYSNIDSHSFEQNNNWGTSEVVAAVEESDTVKKIIFLSSVGVYGSTSENEKATEKTTPNPRTVYAISKLRAEGHINRLKNKETFIIRCGNIYGYSPAIRFDSVINKFLFDSHFNNRISIHGSGKQSRSFIHINKVSDTLAKLISKNIPSGLYNLTDKNLKVLDLVDVFKDVYKDLEFIFINQHLVLRELEVSEDLLLNKYIKIKESDLKDEIIEVKNKYFSFDYSGEH